MDGCRAVWTVPVGRNFHLMLHPVRAPGVRSGRFVTGIRGRKITLVELRTASRWFVVKLSSRATVQLVDGHYRRHSDGLIFARGGTVDRATRAGLQKCARWPQGARSERDGHLPVVPDLSPGRRH